MKKYLFALSLLLLSSLFAKAQSNFTASQIEDYLKLSPEILIPILNKAGYSVFHREDLPKETQYQFVGYRDRTKRLLAIYYGSTLGIFYVSGSQSEQTTFKSSLKSDGFTFKENGTKNNYSSVKYVKAGGLAGKGLEVELGSVDYEGKRLYTIFLWNWRQDTKTIKSLSELPNPYDVIKGKIKKYTVLHHSGQDIFEWYKVHYKKDVGNGLANHSFYVGCILIQIETEGDSVTLKYSDECGD